MGGRHAHVFAALDLGTNNCRLLVARAESEGACFRVIDAFSRIVRLGERLSETGLLGEEAIDRTIRALRVCSAKMERRSVTRVRSVATEACRRARNGAEFIRLVGAETGIQFDIISPDEEGRLALAGCRPLILADARYALVFDIGGGSTELLWVVQDGAVHTLADAISLPIGVVTLAEEFGGHYVTAASYRAMVEATLARLVPFEERNRIRAHAAAGVVQVL
ncbi:MAG: Ppx/GppA family phosphatase, partial [Alphaproteobacteria bacterium]|nr:Ppx/GppA family phosphatase [Alphaproteobacteria bacterium]